MPAPRVRILLLNWNNARDTIECLESVYASSYADFDVVLCDNASTDGSLEAITDWVEGRLSAGDSGGRDAATGARSRPWIAYERATAEAGGLPADEPPFVVIRTGGNLGFAGGNNVGLRYILARGGADFVWLLNNDNVIAPTTLRALVDRALEHDAPGAVGGTILEYHAPDRVQDIAGGTCSPWHGMVGRIGHGNAADAPRPQPARLDFITGGCMLVRTAMLQRVGLLDERFFMYGEDADWCLRMRAQGFTLGYAPDAEVWHKGAGSAIAGSPSHEYNNVKASLLLIHKHRPSRLPVALAYSLYRCLLPKIVRMQRARLLAVLRAYRDLVRELGLPPRPPRIAMSHRALTAPASGQR